MALTFVRDDGRGKHSKHTFQRRRQKLWDHINMILTYKSHYFRSHAKQKLPFPSFIYFQNVRTLHLALYLLTYLLTPWCRVLLEILTGLQLVKKFTEPKGSLPHSQVSATCLYPGPAQSSPYTHIPSLSLRFPHQDPIHPPLLTHTHHMPSPSHSSRFYRLHNIGWRVQII